jgi:hypothetical protein
MAIAPQSAMPIPAPTTRLSTRHPLVPLEEPSIVWVVARLAGLMTVSAFAVGFVGAIVLAVLTGGIAHVAS